MSRRRNKPKEREPLDPNQPRLRANGAWGREDGSMLYTIVTAANRSIVWAHNEDQAYAVFCEKKFPRLGGAVRMMPPKRDECRIRFSNDDEASLIAKRGNPRTKSPPQESAIFDASTYDRTKGAQMKLGNPGSSSSSLPTTTQSVPGPDPVLAARLRSRGATSTPAARSTDPVTSHAAALSITPEALTASQNAVLRVLGSLGSGTDEEIAAAYTENMAAWSLPRQSSSGMRTRRRELVDRGLVKDTEGQKRLKSGRYAIVWALDQG